MKYTLLFLSIVVFFACSGKKKSMPKSSYVNGNKFYTIQKMARGKDSIAIVKYHTPSGQLMSVHEVEFYSTDDLPNNGNLLKKTIYDESGRVREIWINGDIIDYGDEWETHSYIRYFYPSGNCQELMHKTLESYYESGEDGEKYTVTIDSVWNYFDTTTPTLKEFYVTEDGEYRGKVLLLNKSGDTILNSNFSDN
jgi:hypothetical protein